MPSHPPSSSTSTTSNTTKPTPAFLPRKEDPTPAETEQQNYIVLRECLSGPIIQKLTPASTSSAAAAAAASGSGRGGRRRKNLGRGDNKDKSHKHNERRKDNGDEGGNKRSGDNGEEIGGEEDVGAQAIRLDAEQEDAVEELVEFVDHEKHYTLTQPRRPQLRGSCRVQYLTTELFTSLPQDLRVLDYGLHASTPSIQERYTPPLSAPTLSTLLGLIPPTIADSLVSYALLPTAEHVPIFLTSILNDYVTQTITPPPSIALASAPSKTNNTAQNRPTACELCGRDWIPLTYHHLIPRSTHDKVRKRGWHPDWRLNAVAWLCRACHDFVHRVASNEELAREWWSVERLLSREDTTEWVAWVGRVRWKKR